MSNQVPERIWLQWYGEGSPDDLGEVSIADVTWERERIFKHDVEFVSLSDHEAELKRIRRETWYEAMKIATYAVETMRRFADKDTEAAREAEG